MLRCYYQVHCSECPLDAEESEGYCGAECLKCGGTLMAIPKENKEEEVWYQCDSCEHGFSGGEQRIRRERSEEANESI